MSKQRNTRLTPAQMGALIDRYGGGKATSPVIDFGANVADVFMDLLIAEATAAYHKANHDILAAHYGGNGSFDDAHQRRDDAVAALAALGEERP